MDVAHLRCFVSVAEELSFTRGAGRLHMATSAVSQRIRDLERHLGHALFVRSNRHVELTEAGADLLPRARGVLAGFDGLADSVGAVDDAVPIGRVGIAPDVPPVLLRRFLALARRRCPEIEVQVEPGGMQALVQDLVAGQCDLALLSGAVFAHGVRSARLATDAVVAVVGAGAGVGDHGTVELDELARLPYVSLRHDGGQSNHLNVDEALSRVGVRKSVVVESYGSLVQLVSSGLGFTFVAVNGAPAGIFTGEPVTTLGVRGFDLRTSTRVAWSVTAPGHRRVRDQLRSVAMQLVDEARSSHAASTADHRMPGT